MKNLTISDNTFNKILKADKIINKICKREYLTCREVKRLNRVYKIKSNLLSLAKY